jgi:hypothetical protein
MVLILSLNQKAVGIVQVLNSSCIMYFYFMLIALFKLFGNKLTKNQNVKIIIFFISPYFIGLKGGEREGN